MKTLKIIWEFVNSKIFGYIVILSLAIFFLNTCNKNSELKETIHRTERNIEVLNDSVKMIKTKSDKMEASVGGFEAGIDELEKLNSDLAEQVNKEKGKVITYSRMIFNLNQDKDDLQKAFNKLKSEYEKPKKLNDSTWSIDWKLAYYYDTTKITYDIYKGTTIIGINAPKNYLPEISINHKKSFITNRESKMDFEWGQKYEGDKIKIFARTSHPAFKAKLLEGTYVDYDKSGGGWFKGFGIGPSFSMGYDFINQQPTLIIGFGINYNLFKW